MVKLYCNNVTISASSGIKVVPRGVSRGVRKIAQSRIPNLSRYEDISEYVLG